MSVTFQPYLDLHDPGIPQDVRQAIVQFCERESYTDGSLVLFVQGDIPFIDDILDKLGEYEILVRYWS